MANFTKINSANQKPPRDASSSSTPADPSASATTNEFMEKLQQEWEEAGARVDRDWFKTFEHATNRRDAYAVYSFDARNPFLNFEGDAVEEGRRRWRRGDLANAILLFEAAVKRGNWSLSSFVRHLKVEQHTSFESLFVARPMNVC